MHYSNLSLPLSPSLCHTYDPAASRVSVGGGGEERKKERERELFSIDVREQTQHPQSHTCTNTQLGARRRGGEGRRGEARGGEGRRGEAEGRRGKARGGEGSMSVVSAEELPRAYSVICQSSGGKEE